jgi:4-carboxymuconolactone decarboxylase
MSDRDDQSGHELFDRVFGEKSDAMRKLTSELDPDLGRWAESFVFGEVWTRDGLDFEERLLVAIVALAAQGQIAQLRGYLRAALREEIPPGKVQQALLMTCVYAGFPKASDALLCWRDVRAEQGGRRHTQ